jgi:ATP/maltotriose-dependent transcriptional regulator MalT
VALFESFNRDLCEVLGVGDAVESLADLERRGFVGVSSERGGFLRLHDLLREFLRDARPLAEPERLAALRLAAGWFEELDMLPEALTAWVDNGDDEEISRLMHDTGWDLFHQGRADLIISSADRLPPALLDPELQLRVATAQVLRAEQPDAQLRALMGSGGLARAQPSSGSVARDAAFQVANLETQYGDVRKAVELFLGPASGHPLALAFAAGAHLALGDLPEARRCAEGALAEAQRDVRHASGEAEAHLNLGEVCLAEGDFSSAAAEFEAALEGTVQAGNVIAECSARYRFGELELARGNYT